MPRALPGTLHFRLNLPVLVGLVVALLFGLTGCYTQLATGEHHSRYDEPDYVEVEEHEDGGVVHNYYVDDPYYGDYRPYTYRRPCNRYYSRTFGAPSCGIPCDADA